MIDPSYNRRTFVRTGGSLLVATGLGGWLAACGSGDDGDAGRGGGPAG